MAGPHNPEHSRRRESVPGVRRVVERAVTGARGAVPRYTRELLASVREERERRSMRRNGSSASPVVVGPHEAMEAFVAADLGALWIGHATVLLRIGGMTILTDPVFSKRIGMRLGAMTLGLARVCPPALEIEHLPPLDVVLISHAHFDHLDRPSLKRLVRGASGDELDATGPGAGAHVITAQNTRRLVPRGFEDVTELVWRRSAHVGSVRVTAIEPAHWGARTALDRHRRFNSYLIESSRHRVLFAGDTAHTHAFDHIGPVDLAVFGIGAYNPWEHAHATPEQVWGMYTRLTDPAHPKPPPRGHLLPMHHSTFILSREPVDEPLRRLRTVAGEWEKHIVAEMPGKMWTMGGS
ncbi:MAG TPA: MBL fold metallo-hydrolase [Phycisphaerales bacterium]|nr:MBL fold metallo-hydrolase [Phycisphaerales bacterium]